MYRGLGGVLKLTSSDAVLSFMRSSYRSLEPATVDSCSDRSNLHALKDIGDHQHKTRMTNLSRGFQLFEILIMRTPPLFQVHFLRPDVDVTFFERLSNWVRRIRHGEKMDTLHAARFHFSVPVHNRPGDLLGWTGDPPASKSRD